MNCVGLSEVRTNLPELLDRVARGEEFTITERGEPIARLIPAGPAKHGADVRAAVEAMKKFRKGRRLDGLNVRELIEEGRRF